MTLNLPNLDDRRWADLVEEGRALIPLHAPEWTDHNVHDPGITLMELFASIAEMDIYRLNRVPDSRRRQFLALIGVEPDPPRGARSVVAFSLDGPTAQPLTLPAGTQVEGRLPNGASIVFQTTQAIHLARGELGAIQAAERGRIRDVLDAAAKRGQPILPFGPSPAPGAAVYFGFEHALPKDQWTDIYVVLDDSDHGERQRLADLQSARGLACRSRCLPDREARPPASPLEHHSVRLVWEFFDESGTWKRFEPDRLGDDTRAFTLDGRVRLNPSRRMAETKIGRLENRSDNELHYVRCRFVGGAYDAAPKLGGVFLNGVEVIQTEPVGQTIVGQTSVQAQEIGQGTGRPNQQVSLTQPMVAGNSLRLSTIENGEPRRWRQRPDFTASQRQDADFVLDAVEGTITFGDGHKGRVVPASDPVVATYDATRGADGNVPAGTIGEISRSPRNQALIQNFDLAQLRINVMHPVVAWGGGDGESLAEATARAVRTVDNPERAVTLADYERLARGTPGVRLARVNVVANRHPSFPCLQAPGLITLVVVPHLPPDRPSPSLGLRRAITSHLSARRVIGTRAEVVGPTYVEVAVRAKVRACRNIDPVALTDRIGKRLDRFLHPLRGGSDGQGWPFGRDVYRSEILQVIDETSGADHVLSLELLDGEGNATCGNACLPPNGLVAVGTHEIEVLAATT